MSDDYYTDGLRDPSTVTIADVGRVMALRGTNAATVMTPVEVSGEMGVLVIDARLLTMEQSIVESDAWINMIGVLRELERGE